MEQPWFQDGLTSEEKARIIALRSIVPSVQYGVASGIVKDLIEDGRVRTEIFSFPSGGKVTLYVVSRAMFQPDEETFRKIRSGLKSTEAGRIPSTEIDLVMLVEPEIIKCFRNYQVGRNQDTHLDVSTIDEDALKGQFGEWFRLLGS